jgi:hypothetical protein
MNTTDGSLTTDWELLEELFEERAAIIEYDGGKPRYEAEQLAAQFLGFENKANLKVYVQQLKARQNVNIHL